MNIMKIVSLTKFQKLQFPLYRIRTISVAEDINKSRRSLGIYIFFQMFKSFPRSCVSIRSLFTLSQNMAGVRRLDYAEYGSGLSLLRDLMKNRAMSVCSG